LTSETLASRAIRERTIDGIAPAPRERRPVADVSLERVDVREVRDDERAWLRATIEARWGDEIAVGRGRVWMLHELPALVAVDDSGERVGVATYVVEGVVAELVSIDALRADAGVGRQLLDAVAATARAAGAERLLVMTTNDNLVALRFYQRNGFRLTELRPGAVDEARAILKPSIPETGNDGIPLRDEIDLVLELGGSRDQPTASERSALGLSK
jgi:ribosomal protein S18 acetylase RimI-like enzyme